MTASKTAASVPLFDRFNGLARRAVLLAFREAKRCQHDFLGTEHVLFGLLCDSSGPAVLLLRALGTAPETILGEVQALMLDDETSAALEKFPLSPAVRRAFERASEEAQQLRQTVVGPEHLLLGLLSEEASEAAVVLAGFGVTLAAARHQFQQMPPAEMPGHLVQQEAKPAALPGSSAETEPTATHLANLVASTAIVAQKGARLRRSRISTTEMPPPVAQPAQAMRVTETQLRLTQLTLGGVLGFGLGCLMDDAQRAIVFAMGGFVLALLRSSLVGTVAGLAAGIMLPTMAGPDFDLRSPGSRLLLAILGALAGSMLGNFWGATLSRFHTAARPVAESESEEPRR
jgi:hypothetical protein